MQLCLAATDSHDPVGRVHLRSRCGDLVIGLGLVAGRPPRNAEDRLKRLLDPNGGRGEAELSQAKRQEVFQAKVTAAANKLGKSLRPSDEQELGKIRLKLLNAGFRQEQAVAVYYGVKIFVMLVVVAVGRPVPRHELWHDADGRMVGRRRSPAWASTSPITS